MNVADTRRASPSPDQEQKAAMTSKYNQFFKSSGIDAEGKISPSALQHVLLGVNGNDEPKKQIIEAVHQWISTQTTPLTLRDWITKISSDLHDATSSDKEQLTNMILAVAFMRGKSRTQAEVDATDLDLVWTLVCGALTDKKLTQSLWEAKRSAQGFLSIALSTMVDASVLPAQIMEMFRLHVWLPDHKRGDRRVAIHSHTAFGRSWVMAGMGTNHTWEVENVSVNPAEAGPDVYAVYRNIWESSAKVVQPPGNASEFLDLGKGYVEPSRQVSSSVVKTSQLVRARESVSPQRHIRNTSYSIPEAAYHSSDVAGDMVHATLFFFDAYPGSVADAPILGPVDGDQVYTTRRDPTGVAPDMLAGLVDACRSLEVLEEKGNPSQDELEQATRRKKEILAKIDKAIEEQQRGN